MRLPGVGAEVEVRGVLGVFVGADVRSDGEVHFTIRACASNVKLIEVRCQEALTSCDVINSSLVSVVESACLWRNGPAGRYFDEDEQVMLGHAAGDFQAFRDALGFQAMLSLRNKAWARSR